MIGRYLSILAALLTALQYHDHGWSAAAWSLLFWLLAFSLAAGARHVVGYIGAATRKAGGPK